MHPTSASLPAPAADEPASRRHAAHAPRVALLAASGVEQSDLTLARNCLREAGLACDIVSPEDGVLKAWFGTGWGDEFRVDVPIFWARAEDYVGLLIPGAVMNPDRLRQSVGAVALVGDFFSSGKPVGALCRGPWTLIEQGHAYRPEQSDYRSFRTDLASFATRLLAQASGENGAPERPLAESTGQPLRPARAAAQPPAPGSSRLQILLWANVKRPEDPLPVAPAATPVTPLQAVRLISRLPGLSTASRVRRPPASKASGGTRSLPYRLPA